MGANKSFRVAVGSADGARSGTWIVFTANNTADWYVAVRTIAGTQKYSFHQSGSWGWGFTDQGADLHVQDGESRHLDLWQRPTEFAPGWTHALTIRIPTNGLRLLPDETTSKVKFVEPRAPWTIIELLEGTAAATVDALPSYHVLTHLPLKNGAKVVIAEHDTAPPTHTITGLLLPGPPSDKLTPTMRVALLGNDATRARFVFEFAADMLTKQEQNE